jgi:hypothetical protein
MFTRYAKEDCSTLTGKDAMRCVDYRQRQANAAISQEVTELLKAYRQCISKNESETGKAKESCAMYRDSFKLYNWDTCLARRYWL